ncbi:MAG: hypothetical protein H0T75_22150 [Rhizobiales bacterium]|nr:hypothetical protein [Hyphomicrobiales bacterium]
MPIRALAFSLIIAGFAGGVSAAGAAETFRQLKGSEIAARFKGMEFTDDEVHWAYVFDRSGRLSSFSMGKKGTGAWRVEKDKLCLDRGSEQGCYEVWTSSRNAQLRQPGSDIFEEGILQTPAARQ